MTRKELIDWLKIVWTWATFETIDRMDCPRIAQLCDEAVEALMEPEARLVTREDFEREPAYDGVLPCWKESRSKTRRCGWVAIVYGKMLADTETGVARYWTGVPTEEQRREMAWPER